MEKSQCQKLVRRTHRLGNKTAAQIAHPSLVAGWKKQALEELPESFAGQHVKQQADTEKDEMYQQIGPLNVELDFLKKDPGRGS